MSTPFRGGNADILNTYRVQSVAIGSGPQVAGKANSVATTQGSTSRSDYLLIYYAELPVVVHDAKDLAADCLDSVRSWERIIITFVRNPTRT